MTDKRSYIEKLHEKLRKKSGRKQRLPFSSILEKEFLHSWDLLDALYAEHPLRNDIMNFVSVLREKGYDKIFRAGQMRWVLMLSRSLKHGLKNTQACVYFEFSEEGMVVGFDYRDKREISFPKIQWYPEIKDILMKLQLIIIE